jgi:hypothetical protein
MEIYILAWDMHKQTLIILHNVVSSTSHHQQDSNSQLYVVKGIDSTGKIQLPYDHDHDGPLIQLPYDHHHDGPLIQLPYDHDHDGPLIQYRWLLDINQRMKYNKTTNFNYIVYL